MVGLLVMEIWGHFVLVDDSLLCAVTLKLPGKKIFYVDLK